MAGIVLLSRTYYLLLLVVLLVLWCRSNGEGASEGTICDDGKHEIEKDLEGSSSHMCPSNSRFTPKRFIKPAGSGDCLQPKALIQPMVCVDKELKYESSPPSHGPFRPVPPKAGEYKYLPPQRWLHFLKRKGVAFLYHPCVDEEQVEDLRNVAESCLNNYVMTPYQNLTQEKPIAVVTWRCVYSMEWVRPIEIKEWLLTKDLTLEEDPGDTSYSYGLLTKTKDAKIKTLCPDIYSNTEGVTKATPSTATPISSAPPCSPSSSNRTRDTKDQLCVKLEVNQSSQRHSTSLLVLTVLISMVLLGFLLMLAWKGLIAWSRNRPRKNQKYKSVSKYFPFTHRQNSANVALPELGMPKGLGSDRQVLLGDSDDDDEL